MNMDFSPLAIDGNQLDRPIVISGPCSAETEQQVLDTARRLARAGIKIFRAGIWKPRTKPGGFEGVGVPGLAWLNKVKEETGMTAKSIYTKLNSLRAQSKPARTPRPPAASPLDGMEGFALGFATVILVIGIVTMIIGAALAIYLYQKGNETP